MHVIYLFQRTKELGSHSELSFSMVFEVNLRLTEDQKFWRIATL